MMHLKERQVRKSVQEMMNEKATFHTKVNTIMTRMII